MRRNCQPLGSTPPDPDLQRVKRAPDTVASAGKVSACNRHSAWCAFNPSASLSTHLPAAEAQHHPSCDGFSGKEALLKSRKVRRKLHRHAVRAAALRLSVGPSHLDKMMYCFELRRSQGPVRSTQARCAPARCARVMEPLRYLSPLSPSHAHSAAPYCKNQ